MGTFSDIQQEQRRQRSQIDDATRAHRDVAEGDQVFDSVRRLFLRSPNGTHFAVVVANDGTLSTVNMGANPL